MDVKTTFKGPEAEELNSSLSSACNEMQKSCINCHTTRTPLWRGGPAGPRSLCNACGIRYRKTQNKQRADKCKRRISKGTTRKLGITLKMGGKMLLQRSLGEEEQAALLLMALSCSCIYA